MSIVCVIPARMQSTRLPRKPLAPLLGRPLIEWVVRNAQAMNLFDQILVATDHPDIMAVCKACGIEAVMTDPDLPSGTDRIHAAMEGRDGEVVVNLQGDEPTMPRESVERALRSLLETPHADAATACVPLHDRERFLDPNVVKVVRDLHDRALYFSRSPLPSVVRRDAEEIAADNYRWGFKHLGLYIYRREALSRFCSLSPTLLEKQEKLEQLRMLENGFHLQCPSVSADSAGVDVPEDVPRAEAALRARRS
jgi:3-deoxy-manno-octulosonate cytidylyltransferase (CMP-KDO synthetase)